MLYQRSCPDEQMLSSVLDPMTQLSTEVDDHLGACTVCQATLETLAAGQDCWQETERAIVSESSIDSLAVGRIAQAVCPLLGNETPSGDDLLRRSHADLEMERLKAAIDPASHPELLGRIGRYELEQLIGYGGMGLVFRARDLELHRVVAVKTISTQLLVQPSARQRFLREARASASLVHPHIVAVHDIVQDSSVPAIVMQFVAGPTLQQHLDDEGRLPWREVLRLGIQLCDALHQAHSNGLIHRDIKPGNVLLEGGGQRAMLTDFGLVRALDAETMTHTGAITGTPEYMSPEQAWGNDLDCRSDLFSLGSLLYTMLTGTVPFRAEAPIATLNLVCNAPHRCIRSTDSEVPKEVSRMVDRLLQKSPRKRWSNALEVRKHMVHLLQSDIVLRPRNTVWKILAGGAGIAFACAATIGGLYYSQERRDDTSSKAASQSYPSANSSGQEPEMGRGFSVIEATDVRISDVRRQLRRVEVEMTRNLPRVDEDRSTIRSGQFTSPDRTLADLAEQIRRLELEGE